ncbi:MAG: tyrosine-type recombinase/integrase [Lachnospiraceae bacterium]|nr:tyrosine-type recombinase/integrase [Lachnospiraceae bacterium]
MKQITENDIAAFEQKLRLNDRAEATVIKYTTALRRLMEWLAEREISKELLMEYREYLRETCTARTVNGVLTAINLWLDMEDMAEYRVKMLKIQRRLFRPDERELTRHEFDRLVQTAKRLGKQRLMLVMETICATGIRVSELKYITVAAAKAGKTEISLKGKIRTILIPAKLCRKLKEYASKQKIASGEIFITRNGTSLSRKQIWAEMKALCEAARVEPTKVYPHNLRHLFARCFYNATCDVVKLADVLGHSSVETTRIYLISTGAEHVKTLESLQLVS